MAEEHSSSPANNSAVAEATRSEACCFLANVLAWRRKSSASFLGALAEVLWLLGLNDELALVVICFLSAMENLVVAIDVTDVIHLQNEIFIQDVRSV